MSYGQPETDSRLLVATVAETAADIAHTCETIGAATDLDDVDDRAWSTFGDLTGAGPDDVDDVDDLREQWHEASTACYVLSIDVTRVDDIDPDDHAESEYPLTDHTHDGGTVVDVCTGTGGPADGVEFFYDADGDLRTACAWHAWWSPVVRRRLPHDVATVLADLWMTAEHVR